MRSKNTKNLSLGVFSISVFKSFRVSNVVGDRLLRGSVALVLARDGVAGVYEGPIDLLDVQDRRDVVVNMLA